MAVEADVVDKPVGRPADQYVAAMDATRWVRRYAHQASLHLAQVDRLGRKLASPELCPSEFELGLRSTRDQPMSARLGILEGRAVEVDEVGLSDSAARVAHGHLPNWNK